MNPSLAPKNSTEEITTVTQTYTELDTERVSFLNEKFEKPEPVYNEKLSENFPGSIIVKKMDGTYFAIRKNGNAWEGNDFKVMNDGSIGAVYQLHDIPAEIIQAVEHEMAATLPVLNRDLMKIGTASEEEKAAFVESIKNLPQGSSVDLYHGLNGGSLGALKILESEPYGVKQISGPCLAAYPVGQFWKPGDAGFKYSVNKDDIEFPGEHKANAKFRMDSNGVVFMIHGITELPLNEYTAVVMRTDRKVDVVEEKEVDGFWQDVVVGEKIVPITSEERRINKSIQEKLQEPSFARENKDTALKV